MTASWQYGWINLSNLTPHPRLRLSSSVVRSIQAAVVVDPLARALVANVTAHADWLLAQPLPLDGTVLLCDTIRDHMYSLGLTFALSSNDSTRAALAARAAAELLLVGNVTSWNPTRFLTVAETMHGVAIGYDWFYDALPASTRAAVEDALVSRGLSVGVGCWRQNCTWIPGIPSAGNCTSCWWTQAPMNWNIVSNGALALAALVLADVPRHAAAAAEALHFSAKGIPVALSKYAHHFAGADGRADGGDTADADGAWPEGPGYWNFVTKYLLAVSGGLVTATGSDNGYMAAAGINATALFALQTHRSPSGSVFNFGDAKEETPAGSEPYSLVSYEARLAANLLGLSSHFPAIAPPAAFAARDVLRCPQKNASGAWDEIVLALMAWDRRGTAADLATLPQAAFYPAHGFAVLRSGWGAIDCFLGLKGGDSMATHQDLDHGSFVWETHGYRWVVDLGSESYALPGMFLPFERRYSYYRKSTRGHNTLAFGDAGGFDPATAETSSQAVNIFSTVAAGPACASIRPGGKLGGGSVRAGGGSVRAGGGSVRPGARVGACGAGRVAVVNLSRAYSRQLTSEVLRSFEVDTAMTTLVVDDAISPPSSGQSRLNVTWAVHTRANVSLDDQAGTATLHADAGLEVRLGVAAKPRGACGSWQTSAVSLPPVPPRFALRGARKLWLVCQPGLSHLRVTLSEL